MERRSSSSSHKRKDHGDEQYDRSKKRISVLDAAKGERREKRRFEDWVPEKYRVMNGVIKEERREDKKLKEEQKFEDRRKKESKEEGVAVALSERWIKTWEEMVKEHLDNFSEKRRRRGYLSRADDDEARKNEPVKDFMTRWKDAAYRYNIHLTQEILLGLCLECLDINIRIALVGAEINNMGRLRNVAVAAEYILQQLKKNDGQFSECDESQTSDAEEETPKIAKPAAKCG